MRNRKFFNFGKMVVPAVAAGAVVTLSTMNGCTPGDRSTGAKEEQVMQHAAEAEAAEAQMAKSQPPVGVSQAPEKVAGKEPAKENKPAKETKPAKEKVAKKEQKTPEAKSAAELAKNELTGHAENKAATAPVKASGRKPASIAGGVFVVQVGAFKVKENADKLHQKLKTAGYPVQLQSIEHSKNGLLHLVRFQPSGSRAEAETVIEDLSAKHDVRAQILNLPKAH